MSRDRYICPTCGDASTSNRPEHCGFCGELMIERRELQAMARTSALASHDQHFFNALRKKIGALRRMKEDRGDAELRILTFVVEYSDQRRAREKGGSR